MQKSILTIGIPTYNRPEKILRTVNSLIPQLRPGVDIVIVDNCSTNTNVKDHLEQSIPNFDSYAINVIRNRVNIGPDANYARCFEYCEGEYMWTLSDDDIIMQDAVDVILKEIAEYSHLDLIGFNFNSNCNLVGRSKPIIISNIRELSNKLDFFGNWLFMSTNVYKTSEYLQHLRFAYWGAYTMASQMIPPMVAISKNKVFILSEKKVADNSPLDDPEDTWSGAKLSLVVPTFLEAPVNFRNDFKAFGKQLAVQQIGTVSAIFYATLKSVKGDISLIDDHHLYIHRQHFFRTIDLRNDKFKSYIQFWFFSFLLKNKGVLKFLMKTFPDRFNDRIKYFVKFDLLMR
jgi:glycosyltransferase involved in cell wall biosynthesis